MAQKAIIAEEKIDRICDHIGVSDAGKEWLDVALDPFKDVTRKCTGYPDLTVGNSVVQEYKFSLTIDATLLGTGASNFDAHVFFDSILNTVGVSQTNFIGNGLFERNGQSVTSYLCGGVNVRGAASGSALDQTTHKANLAAPTTVFSSGKARVIYHALEINNVTPTLYKSGTMTLWRGGDAPDMYSNNPTINVVQQDATTNCPGTAFLITEQGFLPESAANALVIPGARQWKAEDGCYIVANLASTRNCPQELTDPAATRRLPHSVSNALHYLPTFSVRATSNVIFCLSSHVASPFQMGGVYITGCTPQSVFTLNVKIGIEKFPDTPNTDIFVMATPSPAYDPMALELYSRSVWKLPPGTKVSNNASGDWIKTIADVLGTVGVPGMGLVSKGVDVYNMLFPDKKEEVSFPTDNFRKQNDVIFTPLRKSKPLPPIPPRKVQPPVTKKKQQPQKKKIVKANT